MITAAGLSVPLFSDIQQALIDSYRTSYGSTTYLGNDSADYQWITSIALKLNDNMGLCQLAYNSRSPLTAVGSALDSLVKINGIARLPSSASSVILSLTGTSGTIITNGVIQDIMGILWSLPQTVVIGVGGTLLVSALCQQSGPISAKANTITIPVGGFTAGWTSVTNPSPAILGQPIEADSSLRARQSISVSLPSETRLAATQAGLEQVAGVTRVNVLENQLSVTDSFGNQGHSLTCVVEGGADVDIATAIFINRGIGCNTQGATVPTMTIIPVTDPNSGNVTEIGFVRPTNIPIYIQINVHSLSLAFTVSTQAAIIAAIVNYLNGLEIGELVTQSGLMAAAMSVMPNILLPMYSIKALYLSTSPSPTTSTDIPLTFFDVALGITTNVNLTVV
jgi:uncharacterized phage protein gp47/JayE